MNRCNVCGTEWDAPVSYCPQCDLKGEAEVLLHVKTYLTGAHNINRLTSSEERIGLALKRIEDRLDYLGRKA